jgi:hypothetical protein
MHSSFAAESANYRERLLKELESEALWLRTERPSIHPVTKAADFASWATTIYAHMLGRYAMPSAANVSYSLDEEL